MDQWQGVLPKDHSRHVSIYKTMNQRSFCQWRWTGSHVRIYHSSSFIYVHDLVFLYAQEKQDTKRDWHILHIYYSRLQILLL